MLEAKADHNWRSRNITGDPGWAGVEVGHGSATYRMGHTGLRLGWPSLARAYLALIYSPPS